MDQGRMNQGPVKGRAPLPILGTLLAAMVATTAAGATVQFDLSRHFNADVVVNNGLGMLDPTQQPIDLGLTAAGNFAFPSQAVADRQAVPPATPNGLPNDGRFAANAFHPEVQLAWSNDDDGDNARRTASAVDTFTFDVPPALYSQVHLFATSGDGSSDILVTINYDDTTTDTMGFVVLDWFTDLLDSPTIYHLYDGGDRIQPGSGLGTPYLFEDSNTTAITGFRIDPNPAKTVLSVTVERTDTTGALSVFGALGVTPSASGVDLYQSADPATIVLPANIVGFGITSPYDYVPPVANILYYQADDGLGAPSLIHMVKAPVGFTVSF